MGRPQDDDPRLHDMGGAIGPADDRTAAEEPLGSVTDEGRQTVEVTASKEGYRPARIHPESLAVDALPDDARTGTTHQDETDAVVDTTGEVRDIDEDPDRIELRD